MLNIFLWCLFVASILLVLREFISIGFVIYANHKGYAIVEYAPNWVSFISPFLLAFSACSLFLEGV